MKQKLYILTLIWVCTLRLTAAETNATATTASCCDPTNKSPASGVATKPATTNAAVEDLPWSFSTTGADDKYKNLPSGLGKSSESGASLWRSAGATVFVLGLLFGVNHWLRKRGGRFTGAHKNERLRIVERVALDHRRSIILIEADGERIVASACADHIESLALLPSKSAKTEVVL